MKCPISFILDSAFIDSILALFIQPHFLVIGWSHFHPISRQELRYVAFQSVIFYHSARLSPMFVALAACSPDLPCRAVL